MTAIKSTGAPRGSVLLAFGVHLKTTVQALSKYNWTVGIFPHLLLADTLQLKFMFYKKATKIDEILTVDLTLCSKCQIAA